MSFIEMDFASSAGGGGGYTVTKVWENTAPTSYMDTLTVTWEDDSDYDFYIVVSAEKTNADSKPRRISYIYTENDVIMGQKVVTGSANGRVVTNISNTGFKMTKPSSSGSNSIPLYIFKVKVDGLMSEFDEYIN